VESTTYLLENKLPKYFPFHSKEVTNGICLYTSKGTSPLFFQKIKHSNRITVGRFEPRRIFVPSSNSVPHFVFFRVLIKFTYRQHQQVRTHGFLHPILPQGHIVVRLLVSIPFEIAWYSLLKASYLKLLFHLHHQNSETNCWYFLVPSPDLQIICSFRTYEIQSLLRCCCIFKLISFFTLFKR
jgi:hypothetical protein